MSAASVRRWWPFGAAVGAVAVGAVALVATPWPGALLIRRVFDRNAAAVKRALLPHAPGGVRCLGNEHYGDAGASTSLDVYLPEGLAADARLPAVVWVHGGAWISGDKRDAASYFELLASRGYAVVAPNYSLGPARHYPTAVVQLNDALRYVQANARRFHLDPDRFVLAGDSAGSQLVSQLATLTTHAGYADGMRVDPALAPEQLRGVVLACGVYDLSALARARGLVGWGFDTAMWAYSGVHNYGEDAELTQMSTLRHVTAGFPPAFITGGNGDALTATQSRPLAARLEALGVPTTTLFFPDDHVPSLPHEYQFTLDTAEGREAFERVVAFLGERTGGGARVS